MGGRKYADHRGYAGHGNRTRAGGILERRVPDPFRAADIATSATGVADATGTAVTAGNAARDVMTPVTTPTPPIMPPPGVVPPPSTLWPRQPHRELEISASTRGSRTVSLCSRGGHARGRRHTTKATLRRRHLIVYSSISARPTSPPLICPSAIRASVRSPPRTSRNCTRNCRLTDLRP